MHESELCLVQLSKFQFKFLNMLELNVQYISFNVSITRSRITRKLPNNSVKHIVQVLSTIKESKTQAKLNIAQKSALQQETWHKLSLKEETWNKIF